MATTKELVLKAITGVIKQGRKSYGKDDVCAYRGPEGLKCAVGHLIDDKFYDIGLEGKGVLDVVIKESIEDSIGRKVTKKEVDYLRILQCCHDDVPTYSEHEFILLFYKNITKLVDIGNLPKYSLGPFKSLSTLQPKTLEDN